MTDTRAVAGEREHVVCSLAELPPGTHRVVEVGRREIGIFNIGGELFALPNICPHQTGPLCRSKQLTGTLAGERDPDGTWSIRWVHDGEIVVCPWHGLEFHVPTGQCIAFPNIRLRRYDVFVEGDEVKIRL